MGQAQPPGKPRSSQPSRAPTLYVASNLPGSEHPQGHPKTLEDRGVWKPRGAQMNEEPRPTFGPLPSSPGHPQHSVAHQNRFRKSLDS